MWCPNSNLDNVVPKFKFPIILSLNNIHITASFAHLWNLFKNANAGKTLFSLERWQTLFTLPWNYTVDWVEKSQTLFTLACSPVVATTLFSWTYCPAVDTFYKWKCTMEKSQTVSTYSRFMSRTMSKNVSLDYIIENPWITNWWLFPLHPAPLSLLSDIWHFFAGSPPLKPISCKGYHQEKETK